MLRIVIFIFCITTYITSRAGKISGNIKDVNGQYLSFSSITIKGTTRGAIANSQGKYSINLEAGDYTLICKHVGFQTEEKKISLDADDLVVDFVMTIQSLQMDEVIIRKGDDPALEIMRQAIRKRNYYNEQVDSYTVDVYIKGLLRSRMIPNKIMGKKIDRNEMAKDGIDSFGKGILFLSESVTKVSFSKPAKIKYQIISSKQSGGGYGLSFPFFVNFYTNNVSISNTNPRGFISPIADNAFHYYKFRYEGNFYEGNKMINKIRVQPKRKNEPLFEGFINIIDEEWRIHSLELTTTSQQQLELVDTLRVTQLHALVTNDIWRTQHQVMYVSAKKFGFDITGNFLNVYSNYNFEPGFGKTYFNQIFMIYDSAANKKDSSYWASVRPVSLEPDEVKNYVFKDSVNKAVMDSFSRRNKNLQGRIQKPIKFKSIFLDGITRSLILSKTIITYSVRPFLKELEYNSVEGLAVSLLQSVKITPRKGYKKYAIALDSRYGTTNKHFNSFLQIGMQPKGSKYGNWDISISGGKRIIQFNHEVPIDPLTNSLYTLLVKRNYMKLYENWFGLLSYHNKTENGWKWTISSIYEDRIPLVNTIEYAVFKKERFLLPNHPYELATIPFEKHQAFVSIFTLSFQPGQRYIQYPGYKTSLGSKSPTIMVEYAKGIPGLLGSDVNFSKWKFAVDDNLNFKLGGEFKYRLSAGGFLNHKKVQIPDLQHFNGNQTLYNFKYLNSFQLAPYYKYSNAENFFTVVHLEQHFNGLITNKIPLFNRLKWNLVAGANTFYVNRKNYYVEAFAGLENIFKSFRIDFVSAYQAIPGQKFGIRIGLGGVLGGMVSSIK